MNWQGIDITAPLTEDVVAQLKQLGLSPEQDSDDVRELLPRLDEKDCFLHLAANEHLTPQILLGAASTRAFTAFSRHGRSVPTDSGEYLYALTSEWLEGFVMGFLFLLKMQADGRHS